MLLDYILNPGTLILDFEVAIHGRPQEIFPAQLKIIGCHYLLARSSWSKIQQVGMTQEYKKK